jgi:hypothetical protein
MDMRRDLLVAMRSLPAAPGASEDPSEALAKLMADTFAQRIAEKREMLHRVRSGSRVTHVPSELDDDSMDLPSIVEAEAGGATRLTASGGSAMGRARGRRRVEQWALIVLVSGLLLFAGVELQRRARSADTLAPSAATSAGERASLTAPTTSGAASTAQAAPATSAGQVAVHVETKPPGAHVLVGGTELGVTPTDVRLPQGTTPLSMQLRRSGYETLVQELVPDSDQRLLLSLQPLRSPAQSPPPRAAAPQSAPPASTGFHRFD